MKTIINIGTNINNFQNVEFYKDFKDISLNDIFEFVKEKLKHNKFRIHGWCKV